MSSNSIPSMFTKSLNFMHIIFIVQSGIVNFRITTTKIYLQRSFTLNLDRTEAFSTGNNSSEFHWNLVVGTFAYVTSVEMGCRVFLLFLTFLGRPICTSPKYLTVTDDTVHKVTSKHHKKYEKSTHFSVQVPPSIFGLNKNSTTPRTLSKM